MVQTTLRAMRDSDIDQVLALNVQQEPHVGALDRSALRALVAVADVAVVAEREDATIVGFIIALVAGRDYASPNYQFFCRRSANFLYVDRIVVSDGAHRRGIGTQLYDHVRNHAIRRGLSEIACEVNLDPPNPVSLAFHLGRGFREVGRQTTYGGQVTVLLLAQRCLVSDQPADDRSISGFLDDDSVLELASDPLAGVSRWCDEARAAGAAEPAAMCLATVDHIGDPDARMVLLRGIDHGLCFYTNRTSSKGRQLAARPSATAVLFWPELERQIRVRGRVTQLEDVASDRYFASRPRSAQLSAWASEQSQPVESQAALEARWAAVEARFSAQAVGRPPHWGGFRLEPLAVEFWQGRPGRLHDRWVFTHDGGNQATDPTDDADRSRSLAVWSVRRLQP